MSTGLELMRKPFPPHQINRLPKGGVTLSYVGHAALTDRLLDADPSWSWEPVAFCEDGLPKLDANGGLWIRLTVCGITRLGYGDSGDKKGPNAMKERIGDALRNAAMRFGAALDLWHKGELHIDEAVAEMEIAQPQREPVKAVKLAALDGLGDDTLTEATREQIKEWAKEATDVFNKFGAEECLKFIISKDLQDDEKPYMDRNLNSTVRSAIRKTTQPKAA